MCQIFSLSLDEQKFFFETLLPLFANSLRRWILFCLHASLQGEKRRSTYCIRVDFVCVWGGGNYHLPNLHEDL